MRRTNRAFIPGTLLLVIQIFFCLALDKALLDKLAIGDAVDFRLQYGAIGTFYMVFSLLVVFGCVAILFDRSVVKYVLMLLMTLILSVIGLKLDNFMFMIPMAIAILSFLCYLWAENYVKKTKTTYINEDLS